jgi:hypothetical protein
MQVYVGNWDKDYGCYFMLFYTIAVVGDLDEDLYVTFFLRNDFYVTL